MQGSLRRMWVHKFPCEPCDPGSGYGRVDVRNAYATMLDCGRIDYKFPCETCDPGFGYGITSFLANLAILDLGMGRWILVIFVILVILDIYVSATVPAGHQGSVSNAKSNC